MKSILGFVPASGRGARMKGELVIKELLPVLIPDKKFPILLFENSLSTMRKAGINNVICTINERKPDLMKYLNLFSKKYQMSIAYVNQNVDSDEYGVPYSIYQASPFLYDHTVIMRFPDTIIMPENCVKSLLDFHYQKRSILTLGVFETDHPERLGPVDLSEIGEILEIQDKPRDPCANNTWNCVIWEDAFLDVIAELVIASKSEKGRKRELVLLDAFKKCLDKKLPVYGMKINSGVCIDISTVNDFVQLWKITQ
ncbi:sugar phosphate nucleotidyltransferase [Clostridiaceae bacterium M8S5]|nr:sugar phosphate nucleotidyltransferase [Clostridiaceae bacterium M8S5]